MELQSKSWLESITSVGNVFALLGTILGFFGLNIPPETLQQASDAAGKIITAWSAKDYVTMAGGVVALLGIGVSFIGRGQADQRVHFFKPFKYELPSTVLAAPITLSPLRQALAAASAPAPAPSVVNNVQPKPAAPAPAPAA